MDYFGMWKSAWDFQKKFIDTKDDDTYWEQVTDEAQAISEKYNNCRFIINLVLAVAEELDRSHREKKNAE